MNESAVVGLVELLAEGALRSENFSPAERVQIKALLEQIRTAG